MKRCSHTRKGGGSLERATVGPESAVHRSAGQKKKQRGAGVPTFYHSSSSVANYVSSLINKVDSVSTYFLTQFVNETKTAGSFLYVRR
jgi:hypothetical protein